MGVSAGGNGSECSMTVGVSGGNFRRTVLYG